MGRTLGHIGQDGQIMTTKTKPPQAATKPPQANAKPVQSVTAQTKPAAAAKPESSVTPAPQVAATKAAPASASASTPAPANPASSSPAPKAEAKVAAAPAAASAPAPAASPKVETKVVQKAEPEKAPAAAASVEKKPAAKAAAKPASRSAAKAPAKAAARNANPQSVKSDTAASAGETVKADTGQAPGKASKATPAPAAAAPAEPAASFKFAPKFAPVQSGPATAEAASGSLGFDLLPGGDAVAKPLRMALDLSTQSARDGYERARESQEVLQKACASSVDAASRGLVTLNAQWIDLMRMHSDATLGLWRATITAPSLSEAVKAQTSGMRQAYDSTSAQLKAIAETGSRVASETTEPLRKAFPGA